MSINKNNLFNLLTHPEFTKLCDFLNPIDYENYTANFVLSLIKQKLEDNTNINETTIELNYAPGINFYLTKMSYGLINKFKPYLRNSYTENWDGINYFQKSENLSAEQIQTNFKYYSWNNTAQAMDYLWTFIKNNKDHSANLKVIYNDYEKKIKEISEYKKNHYTDEYNTDDSNDNDITGLMDEVSAPAPLNIKFLLTNLLDWNNPDLSNKYYYLLKKLMNIKIKCLEWPSPHQIVENVPLLWAYQPFYQDHDTYKTDFFNWVKQKYSHLPFRLTQDEMNALEEPSQLWNLDNVKLNQDSSQQIKNNENNNNNKQHKNQEQTKEDEIKKHKILAITNQIKTLETVIEKLTKAKPWTPEQQKEYKSKKQELIFAKKELKKVQEPDHYWVLYGKQNVHNSNQSKPNNEQQNEIEKNQQAEKAQDIEVMKEFGDNDYNFYLPFHADEKTIYKEIKKSAKNQQEAQALMGLYLLIYHSFIRSWLKKNKLANFKIDSLLLAEQWTTKIAFYVDENWTKYFPKELKLMGLDRNYQQIKYKDYLELAKLNVGDYIQINSSNIYWQNNLIYFNKNGKYDTKFTRIDFFQQLFSSAIKNQINDNGIEVVWWWMIYPTVLNLFKNEVLTLKDNQLIFNAEKYHQPLNEKMFKEYKNLIEKIKELILVKENITYDQISLILKNINKVVIK